MMNLFPQLELWNTLNRQSRVQVQSMRYIALVLLLLGQEGGVAREPSLY